MSKPRPVFAGRSYLITRRCTQRQFLMRPDPSTNNAYVYCLAVAAQRYEIDVLFTIAMSNHHHTGIFDRHGNYPAFLEYFHKLFAKCQNSLRGRWENFWSSRQTSVVLLASAEDALDKLVYSLCNPVQAGLVERARQWPGVSSLRPTLEGRALVANRPRHFFRTNGLMPQSVTLKFQRVPGYESWSSKGWRELILGRVARVEQRARRDIWHRGQRPLGPQKVLAQSWRAYPRVPARKRALNPRVAAKDERRRAEILRGYSEFLSAYQEARRAFLAGIRTVLFPMGTYWLRRNGQVVCEGTPYCPS